MADSTTVMSQAEISALKETLCAQQKLLQKLYNELEAEREASATAASEALSVILRLQGEKAAVKMEAEHYKRLAEEKMCHAEESFAMIEDLITQKEMELAALDYQVQTYKCQLMSMGFPDPGDGDTIFPESLLHRNECLSGNTSLHQLARRNSAPLLVKYKKATTEGENSGSPEMDFISKTVEEQTGEETNDITLNSERKVDSSVHVGISSYAEQIRELELKIKEIAGPNYASSRNETQSPSLSSRPSAGNLCSLSNLAYLQHETRPPSPQPSIGNPNKVAIVNEIDWTKHPANLLQKGEATDIPCSSRVHDVFEVPQVDQDCRFYDSSNEDPKKTACQASEIIESEDYAYPEAVKSYAKYEPEWLKKLSEPTHNENLCNPSDIAAIDRAIVHPTRSVSESQFTSSKLNRSLGITEVERLVESAKREEELTLLNEIKEKLNALQEEIRRQKVKKSSTRDEPSLNPLSEAMLYFWL